MSISRYGFGTAWQSGAAGSSPDKILLQLRQRTAGSIGTISSMLS
jgi:hypothetical protein